MKASYSTIFLALIIFSSALNVSWAVTCDVTQLSPCLSSITVGTPPSQLCCSRLKSQSPCLCQFMKNPVLQPYVKSPNADKIANICHTPTPRC
ncbi:hypothetical protein ACHQM5_009585 [Ranunculus cassubicifolius]